MMQELVNLVVKKTGIGADQAKTIIGVVLGFLKQKLPAPVAGEIDTLMNSNMDLSKASGMLGGLLGKKK